MPQRPAEHKRATSDWVSTCASCHACLCADFFCAAGVHLLLTCVQEARGGGEKAHGPPLSLDPNSIKPVEMLDDAALGGSNEQELIAQLKRVQDELRMQVS